LTPSFLPSFSRAFGVFGFPNPELLMPKTLDIPTFLLFEGVFF
jgi:hypothetical protein